MKFLAALFLVSSVSNAAIPLKSELNAPICLKREYSEEHMRANPKQLLTSLYIYLATAQKTYGDETFIHSGAEVFGRTPANLYVNREPTCESRADGSIFCFAECDGGSFELVPRETNALFRISKDYYFPLFQNGFDRETATEKQTLSLDAKDRHNNVYKVFSAPIRECLAVKKLAKKVTGGC